MDARATRTHLTQQHHADHPPEATSQPATTSCVDHQG
jgi:hypothetical protein